MGFLWRDQLGPKPIDFPALRRPAESLFYSLAIKIEGESVLAIRLPFEFARLMLAVTATWLCGDPSITSHTKQEQEIPQLSVSLCQEQILRERWKAIDPRELPRVTRAMNST